MLKKSGLLVVLCAATTACAGTRTSDGWFRSANQLFSADKDEICSTTSIDYDDYRDGKAANYSCLSTVLNFYLTRAAYAHKQEVNLIKNETPETTDGKQKRLQALVDYRDAGFDASRIVCQYTLDILGESQASFRYGAQSLNLISGLSATIMGIANASAETLAIFAAGDSVFDSWVSNFEDYAYISASPRELARLVQSAQQQYRNAVSVPIEAPKTYEQATLQIQTYNRFCLATGMRNLVDEAVRGADVEWNDETDSINVIGASAMQRVRASLQLGELSNLLEERGGLQVQRAAIQVDRQSADRRLSEAKQLVTQLAAVTLDQDPDIMKKRAEAAESQKLAEANVATVQARLADLDQRIEKLAPSINALLDELNSQARRTAS